MAIHHATQKKADEAGITLTMVRKDGEDVYSARHRKVKTLLEGDNPKILVEEMMSAIELATRYRSLKWKEEDDGSKTVSNSKMGISVTNAYLHRAADEAIKLWKEAHQNDASIEDETDEDDDQDDQDDEDRSGSIVSPTYRARYAEAGHPTHCGDWLAEYLIGMTTNAAGFNHELFIQIAAANGVDLSKYDRVGHGWQGRLRMTGRNMMGRRIVLFQEGYLHLPDGTKEKAPDEWLNADRQRNYSQGRKKKKKDAPAPVATAAPPPSPEPEPKPEPAPEPEVADRFGVNPPGLPPVQPKKGRSSNRRMAV